MSELLTALSAIFVVSGAFLLVANRFSLPPVPFFILAGLAVAPIIDERITLELAQYGIAFLVFTFGVRIQFESVRPVLGDSEIVALGQVLVIGVLGFVAGFFLGVPLEQAIYLAIAAALSSTIVGTRHLRQAGRANLVHGRLAESIQFVQDLLAIVFVLFLSAEAFAAGPIATKLGYGILLLSIGIVNNRYLFDRISRLAEGSDEHMIVGVIALLIVFLAAAEFLGVSIVVGSFAAGLAVRHDAAAHLGMVNGLRSITDFFAAIFFVTLGALVAAPTLEMVWIAAVLGLLTAVVKPAVTTALLVYTGYEVRSATLTGLSLDQVSEFALIIAIEALLIGILTQSVFDAIVLAAAVTMITSSLSSRSDERIYRALADRGLLRSHHEKIDERSSVSDDLADHVVVIGFGRQGQRLVDTCEDIDRPVVVVENDPALLDTLESQCDAYVFGDALEEYTWEKANIEDAQLVVSTVDSERLSDRLLSLTDGTDVVLRARTAPAALQLLERGALYVNVPERLAAKRLIEYVTALVEGDLSREELRERHLTEIEEERVAGYHTAADELNALQ